MDPQFWLDRWKQSDTGFHREKAHGVLTRFWPRLDIPKESTVFVPLCGMSWDMVWLANAGHKIIGVELSDIAIDAFFKSQNLTPQKRRQEDFTIWSSAPYEIWHGDMFKLPASVIGSCTALYDRASLVALPEKMQVPYAHLLKTHLPSKAKLLLVSLTFDQDEMKGPPFSTPRKRIKELFEPSFEIETLDDSMALDENDNLKKRGLTALSENCYLLQKRI